MAVSLKHNFVSPVADLGEADKTGPDEWNAEHNLTLATDRLLGRDTAGDGAVEEISVTGGLEFTGAGGVQIADAGVTNAKLATNAVTSSELANGAVQTINIGNGQVTTVKIANNAVDATKLDDTASFVVAGLDVDATGATGLLDVGSDRTSGIVGGVRWFGHDSGGANSNFAQINTSILDNTAASEDGRLDLLTWVAGAAGSRLHLAQGVWTPGATGGDQGADTINASGLFVDSVPVITSRAALVRNSTAQAIADSTITVLDWDTEDYDDDGIHESVTNPSRLTVPTGVTRVRLTAYIDFAANSTGRRLVQIRKNGTATVGSGIPTFNFDATSAGITTIQVVSAPIVVAATDFFEIDVFQNSGVSIDVRVGSWFGMEIIE